MIIIHITGYEVENISNDWLILSKDTIKTIFDEKDFSNINIDDEYKKLIMSQINNSEVEMLFYKKYNENFNNNIHITATDTINPPEIRTKYLSMKKSFFCKSYQKNLKDTWNRNDVNVDYCKIDKIGDKEVLIYSNDGLYQGTKNLGYLFISDDKMIRFIVNCDAKYCKNIKYEVEDIIKKVNSSPKQFASETQVKEKLKAVKDMLPANICKYNGFFRQCYKINEQECYKQGLQSLNYCIGKINTHNTTIQDYNHLGELIGRCSGEKLANFLEKKFINSTEYVNFKY